MDCRCIPSNHWNLKEREWSHIKRHRTRHIGHYACITNTTYHIIEQLCFQTWICIIYVYSTISSSTRGVFFSSQIATLADLIFNNKRIINLTLQIWCCVDDFFSCSRLFFLLWVMTLCWVWWKWCGSIIRQSTVVAVTNGWG